MCVNNGQILCFCLYDSSRNSTRKPQILFHFGVLVVLAAPMRENKPVNRRKNAEIRCIKLQPYRHYVAQKQVHMIMIAFIALNSSLVPLIQVEDYAAQILLDLCSRCYVRILYFSFSEEEYILKEKAVGPRSHPASQHIYTCVLHIPLYRHIQDQFSRPNSNFVFANMFQE